VPYVKTSTRTTRGGVVRYLQLAHNEWDAGLQRSRTKVLYNFGREDELDREAVGRLVTSLSRLLEPGAALAAAARAGWEFVSSVPLGGACVLDGLWRRLGIDAVIRGCAAGRRLDGPALERTLFALVANRALAPSSKLAAAGWVGGDVHIDGLPQVSDDACYRAMDELQAMEDDFGKKVYDNLAHLLNLEVDLLFFDTTSTYFETGQADEVLPRDEKGRRIDAGAEGQATGHEAADEAAFRSLGKSKDSRPDLPQVIVGMAVTRDGIPVRCRCWPGDTGDSALIRQARDDMREWTLARIIWVGDRGFSPAQNRRHLMRAGGAYILGEKLRSAAPGIQAALARQGRYRQVAENMHVKEVRLDDVADRMVICYNPGAAVRDAAVRDQLLTQLSGMIEGSDALSGTDRARLSGIISTKPGLKKFLKTTPGGLLRIDRARIKAEQRLDGKFLLRCGDAKISATDIAPGYKQLLEVERGWRDMKQIIDLRPVYHHLEDRIRAHVTLCWLALLLIRITETRTGQTWNHLRAELQRIHLGTFTGDHGTFTHRTQLTASHKLILKALDLPEPPLVVSAAPATP
jgi:hypothetical protein